MNVYACICISTCSERVNCSTYKDNYIVWYEYDVKAPPPDYRGLIKFNKFLLCTIFNAVANFCSVHYELVFHFKSKVPVCFISFSLLLLQDLRTLFSSGGLLSSWNRETSSEHGLMNGSGYRLHYQHLKPFWLFASDLASSGFTL